MNKYVLVVLLALLAFMIGNRTLAEKGVGFVIDLLPKSLFQESVAERDRKIKLVNDELHYKVQADALINDKRKLEAKIIALEIKLREDEKKVLEIQDLERRIKTQKVPVGKWDYEWKGESKLSRDEQALKDSLESIEMSAAPSRSKIRLGVERSDFGKTPVRNSVGYRVATGVTF